MNKIRRWILVELALCLCVSRCEAKDSYDTKVDQLFSQWNHSNSPGAAVVIVKDGAVVYQHGYGSADLEHGVPITPQTVFDIASTSKQFTGLAIAMLIEQRKLSLDDDVRKYLPDVPDFGSRITIANLLQHTSGLRDWPTSLGLSGLTIPGDVINLEIIMGIVRHQRELDFKPGDEFNYSNTGYNLLAAIVAKITKQSFRSWTGKNLFHPLGMKHTHVCDDPFEIIQNRAEAYRSDEKGGFRRGLSPLSAPGSSSLFTSAEDMGKWLINFDTAQVGGKTAIELIQQPGKFNDGTEGNYNFGLNVRKFHDLKEVYHGGAWWGYRSGVFWFPKKRLAIAILSNLFSLEPNTLAEKIAGIYLDYNDEPRAPAPAAPKPPAPVKISAVMMEAYVGDYWSDELQVIYHVGIRHGHLGYWLRTRSWREMLPTASDCFTTDSRIAIEFTRNPNAEVIGMNLTVGRPHHLRFTRVSLPTGESAQMESSR